MHIKVDKTCSPTSHVEHVKTVFPAEARRFPDRRVFSLSDDLFQVSGRVKQSLQSSVVTA